MRISDFRFLDPDGDPDRHQNWTHWSLGQALPLQEISSKSVHNFFSYPTSHLTYSFCQRKHGYLAANSNYHYLKHFLPISITCKFHTFHVYRQIPLLANSTGLPLLPNSIACKFLQYDFTVKVHYMQILRQSIYCQNPLLALQLLANSHNPSISVLPWRLALRHLWHFAL